MHHGLDLVCGGHIDKTDARKKIRLLPKETSRFQRGTLAGMTEVTRILSAIEEGDPSAAEQLLPLVYEELRKLAAQKMAQERSGQTLEATALVHEAYLRLVAGESQHWNSRGHFFAAAAEAMRRILVEQARRKRRHKHGRGWRRIDLDETLAKPTEDLLSLNEARRPKL